jgi:uncharacterized protein (TIGR02001 family)
MFLRARPVAEPGHVCAVLRLGLILGGLSALPAPGQAQPAGSISLASSEMFRGESISSGDPVVSASVSLDSRSGFFAGASASLALNTEVPRISALVQYVGYAKRSGELTAELGVIHRSYARIVDTGYRRGFFEGFVGLGFRGVKLRAYLAPDYIIDGRNSYYVELNGRLLKFEKFQLEGHAGLSLIPYDLIDNRGGLRRYQDLRLQLTRPVGSLFVSVGVNGNNYPVYSDTGRARVFATISRAF